MASQALGYAEVMAGGVLVAAGIGGSSIADIVAGKYSPLAPLLNPENTAFLQGANAVSGKTQNVALTSRGGRTSGKTANPFPSKYWVKGRIDQGVDYGYKSAGAPIYSPVDGKVIKTGAPGWPGGGGVLIQPDDHSLPGAIFIYEGIAEMVHAGDRVHAGQLIGKGANTGSIEIGWADRSGVPLAHSVYHEGMVTSWGKKMEKFLASL